MTHAPTCDGCLLLSSCIYPYIFETRPPEGGTKMRRYNAVPHPYALDTRGCDGRHFAPGENVELDLMLFGHGNRHLSYMVHALARAAQEGIGRARSRLRLARVLQANGGNADSSTAECIYSESSALSPLPARPPDIPPAPATARLTLHTPLRLKHAGQLVKPDKFCFADLFGNLLRRISMLTVFHTDTPLETDFAALMQLAREVTQCRTRLKWRDWTRYSSRQKTIMQMGGLLGEIVLEEADWSPFWPYLWLGQWTQAGHRTVMGLGRYSVEPGASL